ncbi:Leucine-rich repeat containing [Chlorella sorokiniana]|uniref:Leucine-rich repeat containing n=1 Tax=Chlorella sorokiniana TaxID=3076 RepID=A0A2P6TQB1_CHLSO|nr:Leucine-rich repeat containing [Chlorella sorokiniana]|eukprot:PRW56217.1 Leucine-rich repeat containing [Chlorella sorokiniana]
MLPQQTWRVRIEGEVQPMAVVALLMALPPNVRWLELAVTPCAGPLLPALARFTNLQRLDITSNAADIGPIAALALLPQLSLDYRRMPVMNADASVDDSVVEQLPRSAPPALAAATALHNLELRVAWSGDVAALCRGLPALRQLSWGSEPLSGMTALTHIDLLHAYEAMQQPTSQRSPGWADLQPELMLQVAALLGNEDRLSLMHTCSHWYATVAAGPLDLLPAAVLVCPPLELTQLEEEQMPVGYNVSVGDYVTHTYYADAARMRGLISRAARLPPRMLHVRIEGEAQPTAVAAMLLALPSTVRSLDLGVSPCDGPLLPALALFSGLQCLTITGRCIDVQWDIGPPAVLAPLRELWLDHRRPPRPNNDGTLERSEVEQLSRAVQQALAAATALHTLELRVTWSDEAAAQCRALPALRCLRLHLYYCTDEDAAAAVVMLQQLTQLTGLTLGIFCDAGSELDYDYPGGSDDWEHCVQLEPLAGLTALTELCLVEVVEPPPDFSQLPNLRRLSVTAGGYEPFDWGSQTLAGLAALTRVEIAQGNYGMELPAMQHPASQRSPGWADLQPELLLQVAALLGNEDRLSLMHTCSHWYAAIATGPPDLLPAEVLACPPLELAQLNQDAIGPLLYLDDFIRQANSSDTDSTLSLVSRAAQLPPQT